MIIFRNTENDTVTEYLSTKKEPSHLAPDLFVPDNLLFSMHRALLTTNGTMYSVIIGEQIRAAPPTNTYREGSHANASFLEIKAFVQQNRTHVFVADSGHGCIRGVNRMTNTSYHVAGICKKVQWADVHKDGSLQTATFSFIDSITYHENIIYVVESLQSRVRKIDLDSGKITTMLDSKDFRQFDLPQSIIADPARRVLYLTTFKGINKIDITNNHVTEMNHGTRGYRDGELTNSSWSGASAIFRISNDALLVIDKFNNRIRLINLIQNSVCTWCFKFPRVKNLCSFGKIPKSVAVISCTAYFSAGYGIHRLDLPSWYCDKDRTELNSGLVSNNNASHCHKVDSEEGALETLEDPIMYSQW